MTIAVDLGRKATKQTNKHGSHRLEKYLNIQVCLEKSLKIKFALKNNQRP